jgi:hypothetical protein
VIVTTVSANAAFVSVTVNVAVRCGPLLAATVKSMLPFPDPDAPFVTVRKDALLTPPQAQLLVVLIEMDDEPPAAGKDVVALPVITSHPFDPLGDEGLPPHAVAASSSADSEASLIRDDNCVDTNRFMNAS